MKNIFNRSSMRTLGPTLIRQNSDEVSIADVIGGFKNYHADSYEKFLTDIDALKNHKSLEIKNFSNNSLNLRRDYNSYCDNPNNHQSFDIKAFYRLFAMVSQKPFMTTRSGGKWDIGELLAASETSQFESSATAATQNLTDAQIEEFYTSEPVKRMRVVGQVLRAIGRTRTPSPVDAAATAAAAPAAATVAAPATVMEGNSDENSVASEAKSVYSESSLSSAHSALKGLQTPSAFRSLDIAAVNRGPASNKSGSVPDSSDDDSFHSGCSEVSWSSHVSFPEIDFTPSLIKNRAASPESSQASVLSAAFTVDWKENFDTAQFESASVASSGSDVEFPYQGIASPSNDSLSQAFSLDFKQGYPHGSQSSSVSEAREIINKDIIYPSPAPGRGSKIIAGNVQPDAGIKASGSGEKYSISGSQALNSQKKLIIEDFNILQNKIKEKEKNEKAELVSRNNLNWLKNELRARINEVKKLVDLDEHATESDRAVRGLHLNMLRASAGLAGEHFRRINDTNYTPTENKFLGDKNKKIFLNVNHLFKESMALKSYEINTNDIGVSMGLALAREENSKERDFLESIGKLEEDENKVKEIVVQEREKLIEKMNNFHRKITTFELDVKNQISSDPAGPFILIAINNHEYAKTMLKEKVLEIIDEKIKFQKLAPLKIMQLKQEEFYLNKMEESIFELQEQNSALRNKLAESEIEYGKLEGDLNRLYG